jgi:hypothetical protein
MNLVHFIVPQSAVQNLDFLRRLISEVRGEFPAADMDRLRMLRTNQASEVKNQ